MLRLHGVSHTLGSDGYATMVVTALFLVPFRGKKKRKVNFPFVIRSFFRTFAGTNEKY